MTIARYPFALPQIDSPLYATKKVFEPRGRYTPGNYGPPADGVEYRAVYNPQTHEYDSARTGRQVSGFGDLSQPQAPMLSGVDLSSTSLIKVLGATALGGLFFGRKGALAGGLLMGYGIYSGRV